MKKITLFPFMDNGSLSSLRLVLRDTVLPNQKFVRSPLIYLNTENPRAQFEDWAYPVFSELSLDLQRTRIYFILSGRKVI